MNDVKQIPQYVIALDVEGIPVNSIGLILEENKNNFHIQFVHWEPISCSRESVKKIDLTKTGKKKWTTLIKGKCDECAGDCSCYEFKVCDRCHTLKKRTTDFDWNQNDKWGRPTYRPSCKDCRQSIDGKNMSSSQKNIAQKTKPVGIWKCPICEKKQIVEMMASKPRMDHDHDTGKFRDWICDSCNTGLGRFKDDVVVLKRAIDYLSNNQQ